MRSFLLIFMFCVCVFWGCVHLEVAYDKTKKEETFFLPLTFGILWTVLGLVGLGRGIVSFVMPYFLS